MVSRLVVLGSCGGWPEAGRACSGYVLEHEGVRIVLDLGYGTLPRLLALLESPAPDGIDAVVVDLHGLFRPAGSLAEGRTPDAALADLGCDADLCIIDATDRHQQPGAAPAPPGPRLNLTTEDAATSSRGGCRPPAPAHALLAGQRPPGFPRRSR